MLVAVWFVSVQVEVLFAGCLVAAVHGSFVCALVEPWFTLLVAMPGLWCFVRVTQRATAVAGQAVVQVNGMSKAMAEASLLARLFVDGVANATVCGNCSSEASFYAQQMADSLLQAVAVAEVNVLETTSRGESRTIVIDRFVENVVEGSVVATGEVRPPLTKDV